MKKWILHILLIGILGTLAASCSQVMEDPISEGDCVVEKQKVMIRFTIALDAPKAASRTWADDENQSDVTEQENYLNTSTVQVLVYDLNGILIGQLQDLTVTRQEESSKQHIYDLVGGFEVDSDIITNNTLSFKLMVFGNCAPITNLNNLADLTFTNPNTTTVTGIPMWGIATYNNVTVYTTVAEAQRFPLTTPVYMLRSMAKIEVTLDEDMVNAGYTLAGATLSKSLTTGYVLPAYKNASGTELALKDLAATTNLGIDEVFHPVTETASNFTINAEMTIASNTAIIYVPEYDATSESKLQITLDLGDKGEKSFFHGYYNPDGVCTNEVRDVIRNHYYKYTVNVDDGLNLELEVQNWTDANITVPFNNIVSYTVTGWEEDNNNLYGYDYYIAKDGNAVLKFQINNPENCDYIVKLSDNTNFTYTKGKDGDNETITISPVNTEPEQYNGKEYETTLSVYAVRSDNGKLVELDMTKSGTSGSGTINHYTIKQQWTD